MASQDCLTYIKANKNPPRAANTKRTIIKGVKKMGQYEKLLLSILSGNQDSKIRFSDLQKILETSGFSVRVRGDHFIYTRSDVEEIINIQPVGPKAKPYQVKQVRNLILKYKLGGDFDV